MNICNELRVSLFLQARVISSFHFISPFSSFFLLRGSGAPEPFLFVPEKGSRKDCPSPISPAQTSAPAGDAPLGAIPCPKAPLCKGSWLPLGRLRSCSSNRPRSGLPAWWGRFPLGVPFARPKGTKTRLGRSPLRTSLGVRGWTCVMSIFGPLVLLWLLFVPPHQAPWAAGPIARWFPQPGLPWPSGVSAAESHTADSWKQRLTRVRPWR